MTSAPHMSTVLVTGAAGFIGSAFVRTLLNRGCPVISVDKLSYAADLRRLSDLPSGARHRFVEAGVEDGATMRALLEDEKPRAIVHFAAESHVDRSIDAPRAFVENNTVGTFELLDACLGYFRDGLTADQRRDFRFLHVSTDEVYGAAGERAFTEADAFLPNSPYAASKAAAEAFVRAYFQTYGLPTVVARPANTYGPWQFPEKLIPLMIARALDGQSLPVYGDGKQRREWLYLDDHCAGIAAVLDRGEPGKAYNLAGYEEAENLSVVTTICAELDRLRPAAGGRGYAGQIRHVADRPGHDRRYAIDPALTARELGWRASEPLQAGLRRTVAWYLENEAWWRDVMASRYDGERLGAAE
ncbi:dTDP-glucose 4,6-dehydratase [Pacificispira sp.]|uniref:dTDP-glucose 4,6-dehydratase n=1 Tax=Pacificispira sp. TaxID=2888761 RepID=UPI003BAB32CC